MKTENFDDAIRKKLESMPQSFTDKDIDKVFSYVAKKKTPFLRRVNGNTLTAIAVAAVAGGLLLWNIFSENDPTLVSDESPVLTATSKQAELPLAQSSNDLSHESQIIQQEKSEKLPEKIAVPAVDVPSANEGLPDNQQHNTTSRFEDQEPKAAPEQEIKSENQVTPAVEYPIESPKKEERAEVAEVQNVETKQKKASVKNEIEETAASTNYPAKKRKLFQKIADMTEADGKKQKKKAKELKASEQQIAIGLTEDSLRKSPSKRWQINIGLGSGITAHDFGGGVFTEIVFLDHWYFSPGIVFRKNKLERFRDEDEFHDQKSMHFKENYENHVIDIKRVTNIRLNSSIYAIPLNVGYRISLPYNFNTYLSLGTELNLAASQRVLFDGYDQHDSVAHPADFNIRKKIALIDHIVFSAGVQKEWKRFLVTAEPFIRTQTGAPKRKNNSLDAGLYLKLFYRLK